MSDPLRTLARRRWQENSEHMHRREAWRRLWSLFFLALGMTLTLLLLVEIVAQRIAGPTAQQIEKGLGQ
jgi:hypothetical protein